MNKDLQNNSLVIIAKNHNPTLVSDYFLIKSNIVENEDQIEKKSMILTPGFAQINLKGGINISVDPIKLTITSPPGKHPYIMGQKYCEALKYIKGDALGINFQMELSDYDFHNWFAKMNISDSSKCVETKYIFENCNISISLMKNGNALIKFNFHYQLNKDLPLGEINIDLEKEWAQNKVILDGLVDTYFKT